MKFIPGTKIRYRNFEEGDDINWSEVDEDWSHWGETVTVVEESNDVVRVRFQNDDEITDRKCWFFHYQLQKSKIQNIKIE